MMGRVVLMCLSFALVWLSGSPLAAQPVFTFDYPEMVVVCDEEVFPLQVTGGQPGYRYQWYRNDEVIANETGAVFEVEYDGTYSVCVTDAAGDVVCSDPVTVFFHRPPTTTGENIPICEGGERTLTLSGYPPLRPLSGGTRMGSLSQERLMPPCR